MIAIAARTIAVIENTSATVNATGSPDVAVKLDSDTDEGPIDVICAMKSSLGPG